MGFISDLVRGNGFNNGGGMMQHQGGAPSGGSGGYVPSPTDPNYGVRGGSGGWQNQFISPAAAGMGPNKYGSGMMNGGPTSTYNGTSEQMQQRTLDYFRQRGLEKDAAARARGEDVPLPFSMTDVRDQNGVWHQGPDALLYDPRRSPDVAAPWRINMPYAGPVNGGAPTAPGGQPYTPSNGNWEANLPPAAREALYNIRKAKGWVA